MEIHERVSATIEHEDATIETLAQAIGVNRKQVSRWQAGLAEMGIYKLKAFCEFYGVSADYILGLPKGLKSNKGFTLAELLIVIAIIAALVAVMIPTFTGQVERAREAADVSTLRAAYADASAKFLMDKAGATTVTVEDYQLTSSGEIESIDLSSLPFSLPAGFEVEKGTYSITFDFSGDGKPAATLG